MVQGQAAEELIIRLKLQELIPIITTGFKITISELYRFGHTSGSGGKDYCTDIIFILFVIIGNN